MDNDRAYLEKKLADVESGYLSPDDEDGYISPADEEAYNELLRKKKKKLKKLLRGMENESDVSGSGFRKLNSPPIWKKNLF